MKKVLVIGDSCTDIYQYGTVERLSPEAPVPIITYKYQEIKPGMAKNVAENLKKMGCNVVEYYGLDSVKTRIIDTKSKQHLIRIDNDVFSKPLDISIITDLQVDAIVISDYEKGFVSYKLIENLRDKFSGPIFIDTKKTDLQRMDGCYIKINEIEFNRAKTLSKELIVTLGHRGAQYKENIYTAPKVEVTDVCGAGDTFLAGLTVEFLKDKSIESAINFAIKAASITVQHIGVYAPSLEEIK